MRNLRNKKNHAVDVIFRLILFAKLRKTLATSKRGVFDYPSVAYEPPDRRFVFYYDSQKGPQGVKRTTQF